LIRKKQEGNFQGDRNVLHLDLGVTAEVDAFVKIP
jgi:hypothetical protein